MSPPYADFMFFAMMLYPLIPTIIFGLYGWANRYWLLFVTLLVLGVQFWFTPDLPLTARWSLAPIWVVVRLCSLRGADYLGFSALEIAGHFLRGHRAHHRASGRHEIPAALRAGQRLWISRDLVRLLSRARRDLFHPRPRHHVAQSRANTSLSSFSFPPCPRGRSIAIAVSPRIGSRLARAGSSSTTWTRPCSRFSSAFSSSSSSRRCSRFTG